jgi:hypothetical protein
MSDPLDDEGIERLRRAAEEAAWLVGRGYSTEATVSFVSQHRSLGEQELRWLDCGTRANRSYRHHIARELDADDVARRPLRIDAASVIGCVEAAVRGAPLLEGMAGVLVDPAWNRERYRPGDATGAALERLGKALTDLRPRETRWLVDGSAADELTEMLARADASWPRVAIEVERVPSAVSKLRSGAFVASADPEVLDVCASWFNLVASSIVDLSRTRVLALHG